MLQAAIATKTDFPFRISFFDVLQRSASENARIMADAFQTSDWWALELGAALSLLPATAYYTILSLKLVSGAKNAKPLLAAGALCASLSPLLLQFLGWDLFRWHATATLTAFMTWLMLAERTKATSETRQNPRGWAVIAALAGFNLWVGMGLMDDYAIRTFPFIKTDEIVQLYQDIRSGHIPVSR